MERSIFLIFPNQLFELAPRIQEVTEVWLLEDELFFNQYHFHQKKLAFHRASMQYYAEKLRSENKIVRYWKHVGLQLEQVFHEMSQQGAAIHCYDPVDYLLERRLKRYAQKFGLTLHFHENPGFYNSRQTNERLVPNVYGMSQFADGGLMTTKPYFSSSNYLKKQGLKFLSEDAVLFDALFWHFVDNHQDYLLKNMRTAQMVANCNRIAPEKKAAHLERAALYFQELEKLTA